MYIYRVKKVHKVVDGDTIDVDIDLGFNVSYYQRVRLAGIDTPESRTTDAYEKKLGLEVKEELKKRLSVANDIVIKTQKPDSTEKYGRILGWLYLDGAELSVNEALIAGGYAWSYMGETKIKDFAALEAKRKAAGTLQFSNERTLSNTYLPAILFYIGNGSYVYLAEIRKEVNWLFTNISASIAANSLKPRFTLKLVQIVLIVLEQ